MSRLMSDILWSMTNYLKFHLGDELELGSARQYGSYWDIPGGDVKVRITRKVFLQPTTLHVYKFASQQYSMSDLNNCLNHPTDPWRLLFLGEYPRVPDTGSIRLVLPKTDKMNIFMKRCQPSTNSIPFYVGHQMATDLTRIHDYGFKVVRKNGCQVQT